MSYRAIETLKKVDYIFCEDTRTSKVLLDRYEIKNNLQSLHKFNEKDSVQKINEILLKNQNIAIISDAGVPCISDPGEKTIYELFKINSNFNVTAVNVGPAYIHTLVASGFEEINQHKFLGFLSKKENKLKEELSYYISKNEAFLFYESVHRIKTTINLISELQISCNILIARELTKINEEFISGDILEVQKYINSEKFIEKGEFVILIKGKFIKKEISIDEILLEVNKIVNEGYKIKDAINIVDANKNIDKKEIYRLYIDKYKQNSGKEKKMEKLSIEKMKEIKGGSIIGDIIKPISGAVSGLFDGIFGSVKDNREITNFKNLSKDITSNSTKYGKVELKIGDELIKIDNEAMFDAMTPNIDFVSIL
ncbi:hypothetical protein FQR65_LT15362 [Abscondita terminalis]|nr:hypothetical protein FQR65_LT15362 [Abscondita terminalis]